MSPSFKIMTASELLCRPLEAGLCELIRGELRPIAPAGSLHGRLSMRIAAELFQFVEAHKLGTVYAAETGFLLSRDPDTVRAPDVAFISQGRLDSIGETDGYWPGAPDLVVEVISPHDRYTPIEDRVEEKVEEWLDAGCRMVIVVNPRQQSVTVYRPSSEISRLTADETLDGAEVLPGWRYPVKRLFS